MKKEEEKVNFDMSTLTLSELIKVYENVNSFVEFLNEKKIVTEEENAEGQNE